MALALVDQLMSYEGRGGMTLTRHEHSVVLRVERDGLEIVVTVAPGVHEWFVDVLDNVTGAHARDWWDYEGYDTTKTTEVLDGKMIADLSRFLDRLLSRQLRFAKVDSRQKVKMEWLCEGIWQQAVPFGDQQA